MPNILSEFNVTLADFQLTVADLQGLIAAKNGLFEPALLPPPATPNTPSIEARLLNMERDFSAKFPRLDKGINNLRVSDLIDNFVIYDAHTPKLSHISVYFGLKNAFSSDMPNKLILIMGGVTLNNSNVFEGPSKMQQHPQRFSTDRLRLNTDNNNVEKNTNFRNKPHLPLKPLGVDKLVPGFYVKISTFLDVLRKIGGDNRLDISFGFMPSQAADSVDWNCIHLIFRKSNTSTILFSTYDGEPGYSGPKPGCPPLGEPEE